MTMRYHVCFLELCVIHNDIFDIYHISLFGFQFDVFLLQFDLYFFCGEDEIHIPFQMRG